MFQKNIYFCFIDYAIADLGRCEQAWASWGCWVKGQGLLCLVLGWALVCWEEGLLHGP